MYPPCPTRLTSPVGLGMSSGDVPVGVSGDRLPLGAKSYSLGNTFLMAWGRGETNSRLNQHRIDPGGMAKVGTCVVVLRRGDGWNRHLCGLFSSNQKQKEKEQHWNKGQSFVTSLGSWKQEKVIKKLKKVGIIPSSNPIQVTCRLRQRIKPRGVTM